MLDFIIRDYHTLIKWLIKLFGGNQSVLNYPVQLPCNFTPPALAKIRLQLIIIDFYTDFLLFNYTALYFFSFYMAQQFDLLKIRANFYPSNIDFPVNKVGKETLNIYRSSDQVMF